MTERQITNPKSGVVNRARAPDNKSVAVSDKHFSKVAPERILMEVDDKLALIREWILHGIPWKVDTEGRNVRNLEGESILVDFPKFLLSFAEWRGPAVWPKSKVHDRPLKRIPRSTLNQPTDVYINARKRIDDALKNLKERATKQLEAANKTGIIARLQVELQMKMLVIEEQERDLIRLRRIADEKAVKLAASEALVLRNNEEHLRLLAAEQAKVAGLTELLSKVTSIGLVRK